jgi:hypothetical protein
VETGLGCVPTRPCWRKIASDQSNCSRLLDPCGKASPSIHVPWKLSMNREVLFTACKAVLKEYSHSPLLEKQGLREGERKKVGVASHKAAATDPSPRICGQFQTN